MKNSLIPKKRIIKFCVWVDHLDIANNPITLCVREFKTVRGALRFLKQKEYLFGGGSHNTDEEGLYIEELYDSWNSLDCYSKQEFLNKFDPPNSVKFIKSLNKK